MLHIERALRILNICPEQAPSQLSSCIRKPDSTENMFLISGLKDELTETQGQIEVEWKIADVFSLAQEAGYYYQSPVFSFAKSYWTMQFFPGGDNIQNEKAEWFSVYLKGESLESTNTVTYTLGMKKADGNMEKIVDKTHNFDKNNPVSGQQKFFQTSELLRRKAELAPKDDLVIKCTLKHNTAKIIDGMANSMRLIELEKLSMDFKELLTSKRTCDATVKLGNKEFRVHKSVLIARSSVFRSMFEHDMMEKKTGVISIDDCDPDKFSDFLQYLYTGKAESISPRSALHLYCTADKYDVKELKSFCIAYMMKNLTVENLCDVVSLGEQYDEIELLSAAQMFFNKNVAKVLSTEKWEILLKKNYRLANKLLKEMATKINVHPLGMK